MGEEIVPIQLSEQEALQKGRIVDIFPAQCLEYAEILEPSLGEAALRQKAQQLENTEQAVFIHYLAKQTTIKMVNEEVYLALRTNRNKLFISEEEQRVLYNLNIAVCGLSVGASLLRGIVASGIAKNLKISDHDILSTSNLNRMDAGVFDIGRAKIQIALERIYEINPFANASVFENGIDDSNIDQFLDNCSLIFEEIDDFKMKVKLRVQAKQRAIPLIMLTNLGDSVLIDIERYDIDTSTRPFNGLVDQKILDQIEIGEMDAATIKKIAAGIVGLDNVPTKALKSLTEIGRTLVGRPQLYGTVATDSALAPYLLRQIFIDRSQISGRFKLSFNSVFYGTDSATEASEERTNTLRLLAGGQ